MKTIEERANGAWNEAKNEAMTSTENTFSKGFIAGAKSEHEELTRWNSPECPPDNKRQVLLKVKTSFVGKIYYKIGSFINGDYYESYSGRPLRPECLGWREIHEQA